MVKSLNERIVAAIDVGTTKICVLVAREIAPGKLEIIGIGKSLSDGLSKGVVIDVAKTIQSIRTAIKEAELMAGVPLEHVAVGISGAHIQSINSQGIVPIKGGEIHQSDIMSVLAAAKAIPVPEGQQILHILPQYFVIDGRDKVLDPIGMHGIRLEVQAHIILGALSSVQNLVKCCESAGVQVVDIVLEQLASALSVLTYDECKLGVAMLDIGGGTSDLALYQQGSIRHTKVIPIAGNHFTYDLATGLYTTIKEAERIKKEYGIGYKPIIQQNDFIEIEQIQGIHKQIVSTADLVRILEPRARELMQFIQKEIQEKNLKAFMTTGLVLTGGGSLLKGMQPLAETFFDVPVRIGYPSVSFIMPNTLQSPMYATSYGLLLHIIKKQNEDYMNTLAGPLLKRIFYRMKTWMVDFF